MSRRLYDTAAAAAELAVPAHAIAVWKNRKRITEADSIPGPGRRGRVPLWDLDDLRPLAEAYHRRIATRRRPANDDQSPPSVGPS